MLLLSLNGLIGLHKKCRTCPKKLRLFGSLLKLLVKTNEPLLSVIQVKNKYMTILGIDTSFDDTAAAVVMDDIILSNVLSSDLSVYQEWGGVVPRLALLSHQKHIDSTVQTALKLSR